MIDLLIIGKNGQLGSELNLRAQILNLKVISYSSDQLDITNQQKVADLIKKLKPKAVFNTAAYHAIPECEKNPVKAFQVNCFAVKNLAKVCKENGAKLFTYSTDYVFDGKKNKPYFESDIPNPLQIYGLSKFCGEIEALNEYSKGTFVIRTNGLYGGKKGSKSKGGNFVLNVIKQANGKKKLEVSRNQFVNPTYAGDLADASLKLLKSNSKPGIYHLANEGTISWYDFAKKVLKLAKIDKQVFTLDKNKSNENFRRPIYSVLKNKKARKVGIMLPSIESGLETYIKQL